MSRHPIWSLTAPRNELGGAPKWIIYASKVILGAAIALPLWAFVSLDVALAASLAVLITSKICWYLNTGDRPGTDAPADWLCDAALHFAWLIPFNLIGGRWQLAVLHVTAWVISYPWSSE